MDSPIDGRTLWVLLACAGIAGCASKAPSKQPGPSAEELARAKQIYTACVEDEIGLEITFLDLQPSGDITVEFAPGYTEDDLARTIAICEARIRSLFEASEAPVLGPPANLGRPASDEELASLLASRASLGFEGAILVEVDGKRRLMAGYGALASDATHTPDAQTAFDCGSIMKKVTAAVIFLLEEDGVLSRRQPLADFFEDIPEVWRGVSVDHVLEHRAGFHDYHDTKGDFEAMDRATALATIFAQEPLFAPGTDSAYSNSGYTLLAALIEEITHEAYRSVVRRRVFEPLGMQRSGFYGDPLWDDGNVAVGRGGGVHGGNNPAGWPAPTWALMGNGGLVSTLEDLLIFAKAIDGDRLFLPATRAAFVAAQSAGSIDGKPLVAYAGGNDFGFGAVVGQVAEDSTYVVVASHVLSPITAEILGVEVLQAVYGALAVLPEGD